MRSDRSDDKAAKHRERQRRYALSPKGRAVERAKAIRRRERRNETAEIIF
jgi:hypothetical protein